ncbi:hypothetical protein V6R21_19990 [Limibacter armeniacum]|uniref:hypothetical protein n=1 Tax=Limibacter armeniacum TaxID=466084 RepID=UPI002FE5C853
MNLGRAKSDNWGSFKDIVVVKADNVSSIDYEGAHKATAISIVSEEGIYYLYDVLGGRYREPMKTDKQGDYFELELQFGIAKDREEVRELALQLKDERVVCVVTNQLGEKKLIGTKETPLRMSFGFDLGSQITQGNSHAFTAGERSLDRSRIFEGSIAEPAMPTLVVYRDNPEQLLVQKTGAPAEWIHFEEYSHLIVDDPATVTAINFCDAGVYGTLDLTKQNWSTLSYVCLKNGRDLDLQLPDYVVQQAGFTLDMTNAILTKVKLLSVLQQLDSLGSDLTFTGRTFKIGVIIPDSTDSSDTQEGFPLIPGKEPDQTCINLMEKLGGPNYDGNGEGWTITTATYLLGIVYMKGGMYDMRNCFSQNSGEGLIITKGQYNSYQFNITNRSNWVGLDGTRLEFYHTEPAAIVRLNMRKLRMTVAPQFTQVVFDSAMRVILRDTDLSILDMITQIEQGDVTTGTVVLDFMALSQGIDDNVTEATEQFYDDTGIEIMHPKFEEVFTDNGGNDWVNGGSIWQSIHEAITDIVSCFVPNGNANQGSNSWQEAADMYKGQDTCTLDMRDEINNLIEPFRWARYVYCDASPTNKMYHYTRKLTDVTVFRGNDAITQGITPEPLVVPKFGTLDFMRASIRGYKPPNNQMTIDFGNVDHVEELWLMPFSMISDAAARVNIINLKSLKYFEPWAQMYFSPFWNDAGFDKSSLVEFRRGAYGNSIIDSGYQGLVFDNFPNLEVLHLNRYQEYYFRASNLPSLRELVTPKRMDQNGFNGLQGNTDFIVDMASINKDNLEVFNASGNMPTSIDLSGNTSLKELGLDLCDTETVLYNTDSLERLILNQDDRRMFGSLPVQLNSVVPNLINFPSPSMNYIALTSYEQDNSTTVYADSVGYWEDLLNMAFSANADKNTVKDVVLSVGSGGYFISDGEAFINNVKVACERDWISATVHGVDMTSVSPNQYSNTLYIRGDVFYVDNYPQSPRYKKYSMSDLSFISNASNTNMSNR